MSALLSALRGHRSKRLPVWFMRQAGRSLPEYRIARADTTILEACLQPDLAAEITLQPVRRHGVDAAIFFSDIMTPLVLAGVDVEIVSGIGPVVENPTRTAADVDRITKHVLGDACTPGNPKQCTFETVRPVVEHCMTGDLDDLLG